MIELTSRQRKILEKEAQPMSAVIQIGKYGVSEELVKQIQAAISTRELIKIKFNEFKDEKKDLSYEIAQHTDSTVVRIIGNTTILYKEAAERENRKYASLLAKAN